jgi:hypothetical protein
MQDLGLDQLSANTAIAEKNVVWHNVDLPLMQFDIAYFCLRRVAIRDGAHFSRCQRSVEYDSPSTKRQM